MSLNHLYSYRIRSHMAVKTWNSDSYSIAARYLLTQAGAFK